MNAVINKTNRARLDGIRRELFDMANSYAGNEHGHIACRLHSISNYVYIIRDMTEMLYSSEGTPADDRYGRDVKSKKIKSLAQYLDEYLEFASKGELGIIGTDGQQLLEQALDAYESTEQVKIRIERV